MKILKAYKYKLKLNKEQEVQFTQIAGSCRFIYNFFLAQRNQEHKINFISPNYYDQATQLPELKEEFLWLKDVPAQVLQQTLKDLDKAFQNFF
jgi:putative transposase